MQFGSPASWARLATGLCLALTAAGCGGAAESEETTVSRALQPPVALQPAVLPGRAAEQEDSALRAGARRVLTERQQAELAGAWGLESAPLTAPPAPARKPALSPGAHITRVADDLPALVRRVPTEDRVVFLTVDDGKEKDPRFNRMMRELDLPFSAFVSGYLARSNYGYFRDLNEQGVRVNNHTVNHKDLRKLNYAQQRAEICGQQDELEREIGIRPVLFRPPYGEYTTDTLRAARSCGITAVPMWNEEAFPDRMEYRHADQRLHPGDIILTHFRGTDDWSGSMTDLARQVLRTVTAQGFALARLDDYLG
ncbi:peptidoglycan/xylan/chitin deacetylase (PgdA/CDA1 family) [Kitasatospora gansuensis]|uniref:Peptidoglycan/xylan/chitin deacetylase (PgdA/CDA1 family) n=1 Tax=Kitasatospora gansuensis TaxID=258050 RepID=A0A7W7S6A7_9ACTN|nr:polysaccharide deacetylase family protein [Kitasatospora gansuensis]MBB4944695.1 peptidoglycan/xylan/chitin deacetylase (PgdA/CDA1 family) [Kitasatospora gansuensis]